MLFASAILQSCASLCDDFLQLASSAPGLKRPLELAVEHLPTYEIHCSHHTQRRENLSCLLERQDLISICSLTVGNTASNRSGESGLEKGKWKQWVAKGVAMLG